MASDASRVRGAWSNAGLQSLRNNLAVVRQLTDVPTAARGTSTASAVIDRRYRRAIPNRRATILTGKECEHSSVSIRKIIPIDEAYRLVDDLKRQGKKVVFTNGCFDVIHPGHTRLLRAARELGDVLVVAVNSDASVRGLYKGPERPIFPEMERAELIAALEGVDCVTLFDSVSVLPVIERMLPNVLVKGATWGPTEIVGREVVEASGGQVVSVPVVEGFSSTSIVQAAIQLFPR